MYPRTLFDAIRQVETGGHPTPSTAVGEAGEYGPYQITPEYWMDAITHRPEIGGTYKQVSNQYYAEWIMMAYWDKWSPDFNPETLARIHNGGPYGHTSIKTDRYMKKIKEVLDANNNIRHRNECD